MATLIQLLHTTINRVGFDVEPDPADYWRWIRDGRYQHEWLAYDAVLRKEHTFIDLGAWVGAHCLYASRTARAVVAVEPDPVAYEILVANLGYLAPRPETHVQKKAIAAKASRLTLGSGCLGASTTRLNFSMPFPGNPPGEKSETFEVDAITLRDLAKDFPDPLFIKIDVEGAESEIFRDFVFFAERKPTVLLELHPFWWTDPGDTKEKFEHIRSFYRDPVEIPHPNSNMWLLK